MAVRPKRKGAAATSTNAVDIAMDAVASGKAPDDAARSLLAWQERLIRLQVTGERLSNALKMLTGLAGLAVAVALGAMIWNASKYQGLVVEPFSVPPDLAARGITGEVVASKVLDRLAGFEAVTFSTRAQGSYSRSWGKEIEVEIPKTGVSLGELQRQLRLMFGRETRVAGEIVRTGDGVVVSARSDGELAGRHQGAEAELETLIDRAGESVYRQTQPYRYSVYLRSQQRHDEARILFAAEAGRGSVSDRAWANIGLAAAVARQEDPNAALVYLERAEALAPQVHLVSLNKALVLRNLGRDEEAFAAFETARATLNSPKRAEIAADRIEIQIRESETSNRIALGDHAAALRAWEKTMVEGRRQTGGDNRARLALALTGLHRASDAEKALNGPDPTEGTVGANSFLEAYVARAKAAEARENWQGVLDVQAAADEATKAIPGFRLMAVTMLGPTMANAKAKTGDVAGARAMMASSPLTCAPCVIARGKIEAIAGNAALADHWFGQAAKMTPTLPFAKYEWGRALFDRGDLAGASIKFVEAHKLSPRFADPLHYWGETLLRQGKAEEAVKRFSEAGELAPDWGRNHLLWGEALAKLDRTAEARTHWAKAARLDLTAAERTELGHLQGAR